MTRMSASLILCAFLLGCSSASPVKTQSEYTYLKKKFNRVAVEGSGEDPSISSAMEQGFLTALIQKGIKAVPVSVIIPSAPAVDYDEKLAILTDRGYEAYLELHYSSPQYGNAPVAREARGVMVDTRTGSLVWVGKISLGDSPDMVQGHQAAHRLGELAAGTLIERKHVVPSMIGVTRQE